MPKKSSAAVTNVLLMVAPVALLGGVGFLLQNRKPAVLTVAGPFEMFIKKARLVTPTPKEVHDGYDTKVEVELGSRGKTPHWWQQGFSGYSGTNDGQVVAVRDGIAGNIGSPFRWTPHLEKTGDKPPRWLATYLLKMAVVPASAGEIRVRHRIQIDNNGTKYGKPMWLDALVRPNGQKTGIPQVSRDPQLQLARWTLDQTPPVDNASNSGNYQWRLIMELKKSGRLSEARSYGVNDDLKLSDSQGNTQPIYGSWTISSKLEEEMNLYRATAQQQVERPRISYAIHDFTQEKAASKMKSPLWIQGTAYWNDHWPLEIKIPFRDAQGKVLLAPRPAPAFKVISTSMRAAKAVETRQDGSDTIVEVVLKGINPKVDSSTWGWQGHFSQHLQDAKGRKYWLFAYKGTSKQPALISYDFDPNLNTMTMRYYLILASIPRSAGKLTFHADVCANGSRRVPVSVMVRPDATSQQTSERSHIL